MASDDICCCVGEKICIEADGPHHFSANTLQASGENLARQRLLHARGWAVVSVPFFKWTNQDDANHCELLQQVIAALMEPLRPLQLDSQDAKLGMVRLSTCLTAKR